MKQLLQRLDDGSTSIIDVPIPRASGANLLVETRSTVISAGTERMLVEFGQSNLLQKARQQPEKVAQVLSKVHTDGLGQTIEAVRAKLRMPIPLGYCHAGVVVEIGSRAGMFQVGDRVVTNGPHAEYALVPTTLAARIPDDVEFEAAAFTPLAAIGLQGIRLAAPTLGESFVVYGLGLIGLLSVQMLRANGCRVIGIDRDPERLDLAERFGALPIDGSAGGVAERVRALTGGIGADAVLLTLTSTSDQPVRESAEMSRKRGRLILVGTTGLSIRREDFYQKELSFTVSCSYGPGRYDPEYEGNARDYPLPFVRWTEQRNFMAVLELMAAGQLDPSPLISHRFAFSEAPGAYEVITGDEPSLGIVLSYDHRGGTAPTIKDRIRRVAPPLAVGERQPSFGVIGAGNFGVRTLLPALKQARAHLRVIASAGGVSGTLAAEQFGIESVTTDAEAVYGDSSVDAVFVLTRHGSHAELAVKALEAGKHVFVEKPLALTEAQLDEVSVAAERSGKMVMVGFNRRFAPLARKAADHLRNRSGPASIVAMVNAGPIPRDHWTQDPEVGGGRIVGEACHWIDLARSLVRAEIIDLQVVTASDQERRPIDDVAHLLLRFADGSTAAIHYLASGAGAFPKERIECFADGRVIVIDNWRRLQVYGQPGPWFNPRRGMDKGHGEEIRCWVDAVRRGGESPIPLSEILEVSRWSIRAAESAQSGRVNAGTHGSQKSDRA